MRVTQRDKLTGTPDTSPSAVDAGVTVVRVSARTGRVTMTEPVETHAHTLWTVREVALVVGLSESTWRVYVHKGIAPPPDDPDEGRSKYRRQPRWRVDTIAAWRANRPGQGARTDLKK